MKVLSQGQKIHWSAEITCTGFGNGGDGCGSVLEVERDDLRYYKGSGNGDRIGDSDPAVMIKCPMCGTFTDLGRVDFPKQHKNLTPWTSEWRDDMSSVESLSNTHGNNLKPDTA